MAGTTVAAYTDITKEVWDSDTMVKQFYDENPWLDMIEKRKRVTIGKRAQVPIHMDRAGGTTVLSNAGGSINDASVEVVDQAQFTLAYLYFPVQIQLGAMNEVSGGNSSVGEALEHMLTSGINNLRNQATRMFLTGNGFVAQAGTTSSSKTITLATLAGASAGQVSGADALQNGWLRVGDKVDVGTTSDGNTIVDGATITSYDPDPTAPTITMSGLSAAVSTTSSDFVSLSGARLSDSTILESGGLVEYAGTTDNTVGGIDASSVPGWNPAKVDSTSEAIDMKLLLDLTRTVRRNGGNGAFVLASMLQLDNIYQLLQAQVRFGGDREIGAGGSESFKWRGNTVHAFPQVPENFLFLGSANLEEFEIVTGKYTKPTWMSEVQGTNRGATWTPGTTHFDDTIFYALGLAVRRRNTLAAATNLKA